MEKLIKDWKRLVNKYHKLGMKTDHNPIQQYGLLCRSEVYNYCACKLEEILQQEDSTDWSAAQRDFERDIYEKCDKENDEELNGRA